MGGNTVAPGQTSADHHHGEADSGIYVVSGHPRFVFLVDGREQAIDAAPGDLIYVPAWVPHREENPSPGEDAVVVLARRSTCPACGRSTGSPAPLSPPRSVLHQRALGPPEVGPAQI